MPEDRTIGELSRLIDRQIDDCARRAAEHVNVRLYEAEQRTMRDEIARVAQRVREDITGLGESLRTEIHRVERDAATERSRIETLFREDRDERAAEARAAVKERRALKRQIWTSLLVPPVTFVFAIVLWLITGGPGS